MTLADLIFSPQGTAELDLKSFDCGRESVNKFFREEAQDYSAEAAINQEMTRTGVEV